MSQPITPNNGHTAPGMTVPRDPWFTKNGLDENTQTFSVLIPYLHVNTKEYHMNVRVNREDDEMAKNIRLFLITNSDILPDAVRGPEQFSALRAMGGDDLRDYMCKIGGEISTILKLRSRSAPKNTRDAEQWDVLAEMPLGYTAMTRTRENGKVDNFVVGHPMGRLRSIPQVGKHFAWLARDQLGGNNACDCEVCGGVDSDLRHQGWLQHKRPAVFPELDDWYDFEEDA